MGAPKLNISLCQFPVSISLLINPLVPFWKKPPPNNPLTIHFICQIIKDILNCDSLRHSKTMIRFGVCKSGRGSEVKLVMFHALLYGTTLNFLNKPLFMLASE